MPKFNTACACRCPLPAGCGKKAGSRSYTVHNPEKADLNPRELEKYSSHFVQWVDVCKAWQTGEQG